ncbi:uncharacterized protein PHALS_02787 [Plasmopara halstedii]|uniref:Uncharacterized protein n=1 Tax=Plasmopara halstedii TaxID=4781 RepID=A0A0P1AYW7_PLAHL|nr:uncharacterized protein PHALS_02787 [Plasmopara halstedii]CEG46384.1 hypothetical protein PHALS_02787 [Plasmopara halstedii]|eukprot:XP_024582753.1 hypothetical protein PHALS_02787 [Plasmopara halstedii]
MVEGNVCDLIGLSDLLQLHNWLNGSVLNRLPGPKADAPYGGIKRFRQSPIESPPA